MNYKKLPHAPENAWNFDGEDLVKQCPGEVSARGSQGCLSQRKAGCMNFAVYKFIFSCTRSLVPNTLLLADSWQFRLPENPCTTSEIKWMPEKVEQVPMVGNLQEKNYFDTIQDWFWCWLSFQQGDPWKKPSSSVIVWNFATGWSYSV